MFYVINYFKNTAQSPFLSLLRFFLASGLVFSVLFQTQIKSNIIQQIEIQKKFPKLSAVMPASVNIEWVRRKVTNLPGVNKIKTVSKEKIESGIKQSLGEWNHEILGNYSFQGLEIIFDEGIKERTIELVKEYIQKLVGQNEVILESYSVKDREDKKTKNILLRYPEKMIIFLLFISWGIIFALSKDKMLKRSYLIEKFQRRNLIAFKLNIIEYSFILGLVVFTSLISNVQLVHGLIMISILMIFSSTFLVGKSTQWRKA
ncbi:MAG: hypothetical protein H6622_16955 [Halobacteriovoraceae bacterium]|nr:hypothetical protein [Halobacteriovoraceae bacterium]